MKIKHLLIVSILGLGLTVVMLWALRLGPVLAATFSVTQFTDDSGACNANCSLREAILAANAAPSPDTINLPAGTHSLSIAGAGEDGAASGDLDITEALTITGAGPGVTVVEASGLADRIFHVLTGTVTISGVTIRYGSDVERGGGIVNVATLRLINSSVISNSARGRDDDFGTNGYGGGIWNSGTLALTQSQVISNSVHGGDGLVGGEGSTAGSGYGGGIWNNGTVMLANSTVVSNSARSGDSDSEGGGIWNSNTVMLTNSIVSGNIVRGDYGSGGGIYNSGTMTLTNSAVNSNTATTLSFGFSQGGGILTYGTATLTNSTVSGNNADDGYGGGICGGTYGGTMRLTNCSISSNNAGEDGGGIYGGGTVRLTNTTVSSNDAGRDGGGIRNRGTVRLINSTVSSNSAGEDGGGIFNGYYGQDTVLLTNTTVSSNTALTGGGIHNSDTAMLKNSIVANNSGGNCSGDITSAGHNLDSGTTCGLSATGDLINTNPFLGPLQNNGGDTESHALLPGSPAIDAADNSACPATDQRGVARPQGGVCDIGAYEVEFTSRIYLPSILLYYQPTLSGEMVTIPAGESRWAATRATPASPALSTNNPCTLSTWRLTPSTNTK